MVAEAYNGFPHWMHLEFESLGVNSNPTQISKSQFRYRIKMKCVNILSFILYVRYTSSQFVSVNQKQQKTHCDSSSKNSLVEHFFNLIFTEFHATPPVCVCVQLCVGQATYCYPHSCLKRDNLKGVDSPQALPHARTDKKSYMFVVDEKNDFLKDFLEKTYVNEVTVSPVKEQLKDMRPDLFRDKYSMFVKYKKLPSVQLRYNLREQVKNMKSDLLKIESVDLSKTRWPMNKRNLVSGHKSHSNADSKTPLIGKTNFFMTMLPANEVANYPPRYFKREIAKTLSDDETNVKAYYLFENLQNNTDYNATETISLETLIDNLVNNSFKTKLNDSINETQLNLMAENNVAVNNSESKSETEPENKTENKSEETQKRTSDVLNMNETMNNITDINTYKTDDNNKYLDAFVSSSTKKFNEMIINLSKRIDKQNNTSMEVAKRIVGNFDENEINLINNTDTFNDQLNSSVTENIIETDKTETVKQDSSTSTTTADFEHIIVTKKNRQRRARKSQNSKTNSH